MMNPGVRDEHGRHADVLIRTGFPEELACRSVSRVCHAKKPHLQRSWGRKLWATSEVKGDGVRGVCAFERR